jgi:hypothetical protein
VVGERLGDGQVEERVALAEDDQPVARLLDVGDHVRREERRPPGRPNRLDHQVEELAPGEWIEARERLVQEQDRRPGAERESQPDLCLSSPPESSPAFAVSGIDSRST